MSTQALNNDYLASLNSHSLGADFSLLKISIGILCGTKVPLLLCSQEHCLGGYCFIVEKDLKDPLNYENLRQSLPVKVCV